MYSGFEFNQDQKAPSSTDFQQKQFNQGSKFSSHDHKHIFNFKAPPFEEPAEGFQIPSQILELFDSSNRAAKDPHNKQASRTSVGSHSTLDSNRGPSGQSTNFGNQSSQNAGSDMSHNQNNMRYPSLNTFGDLNTSNLSNKDNSINMSLNNVSRDSALNTSAARRKGSMHAGKGNKNYQVNINEDVSLIERIEILLNQITLNHNKSCPFCNKVIDIKKCNFQNISAFQSHSTKRYYLTHFDCYLKSNSNPSAAKVVPLTGVVEARVNSQLNPLPGLDTSNFLRSDRRAYFVSIEGYHPISSYLLFRIDKICHGLEHASHRNQLLYLNLANKTSSIFEPNSYVLPFGEFRMVLTIHMSHANEDPYTYEYLVDFSQVKLSTEQKTKYAEVICQQDGNNVTISAQLTFDPENVMGQNRKMSMDASFQSATSISAPKPDFNKNVNVSFKYFTIGLPLRRVEQRAKQPSAATAPIGSQNTFGHDQPTQQTQQTAPITTQPKKPHARLQLNPHAPLFSGPSQSQEFSGQGLQGQAQNQGGFLPPGVKQQGQQQSQPQGLLFNQQGQGFHQEPQGQGQFQDFGAGQGFNQGQRQGGGQLPQMQQQQQQNPSEMMPPGLGLTGGHGMLNFGGYNQQGGYQGFGQGNQRENEQEFNNAFGGYGKDMGHSTNILKLDNQFEESNQPQFQGQQNEGNEGGYGEYPQEMNYGKDDQMGPRGRGNRPANLYTAVLSGRKREDSLSNSPSLHNMQNKYFSATSTPRSARGFDDDTPLSQGPPNLFGDDTNTPLSEEMFENFKLEDHIGEITEFAKTYNGSRILQKFFPKANQDEVSLILGEIESNLEELMLDPYANYMFQTLAQSCSADQRFFLLQKIAPSMTEVACDRKGTHALQSLIALISRDSEEQLLRDTLKEHIVELSFDPQGTHLVQKLITSVTMNNIDFIFEPIVQRFVEVSNHSFGLCVLKTLMTKIEKSPELKRRMIRLLYDNLENLIQNPYGNYALQHALDTFGNDCSMLYDKTFERIVQYSNQKFSSNVIEKCLVVASPEYKRKFVRELARTDRIVELMKNKYGNFVLLKALKSVPSEDRQIIMQSISKNLNSVTMAKYKNSWAKFIEENPLRVPGLNQPKPSIFRHNSGNSEGGVDKKGMKEEKSQFNRDVNKEGITELGSNTGEFEKGRGYNVGGHEFEDERESRSFKENIVEGKGPQQGVKKGIKGANQKFYDDKNQHYASSSNKWGFNNFY